MGRVLSDRLKVTVATPFPPEVRNPGCNLALYSFERPDSLRKLAELATVLVLQGVTLVRFPFLARLRVPIVVDLYCPFTIEHLEMIASRADVADPGAGQDELRRLEGGLADVLNAQNMQLALGDFFICASERQRDFWIGALHAIGRINESTYAADRTLRSLIDVVPFGTPDYPVEGTNAWPETGASTTPPANVMKGVRAGIKPEDHVLLWAGAILDWQDPQTLVRAVASLATRRSDVKLFFMGTRHPNPEIPPMRAVEQTISLARDLEVLDSHVFFNDWVAYDERGRYLVEADLGCSTHRDHLETRLSFRTRMLDYLWAGLPIVCTQGDVFAALVAQRGLGRVVPPDDAEALARAIEQLLDDPIERAGCRRRLLEVADEFRWHSVVGPLAAFCASPRFAADYPGTRAGLRRWIRLRQRLKNWAMRTGMSRRHIEKIRTLPLLSTAMNWRGRSSSPFSRILNTTRKSRRL
jgi:glycosyltransferase involved in cell wall biosynthesis